MNLKTLGLFLIAGILGSTNADRKNRVPPHLRVLGYLNTTVAEVEKFDEEMCTKNGGPSAYDDHKKSWEQWSTCLHSVQTEVSNEAYSAVYPSRNPSMDIFYEKYCYRISYLEDCFRNITDSMKACLDPEKHENANVLYNTVSSILRFFCEKGTPHMTLSELRAAESCIAIEYTAVHACANQTIIKYVQATILNGATIGGLGAIHLLVPDNDKCTELEKFQRCAIEALTPCLPSKIVQQEKSIFELVKKSTHCNRFLKSQASLTHVVNLMLMTAVTVMSLRFTYK